jgi:predicted alpha/beta superfamily hydrolase
MFTKPDLFSAYIAVTPAVVVGNGWLLKYEEEFAKAGKSINARLYMTMGGTESAGFVGDIKKMDQRLATKKYSKLAYEFRVIDGEGHAGNQTESYNRGLRFVFAPVAPKQGAATN